MLRKGPSSTLELLPAPDPDALAEAMVAFANAHGGTVMVGVDERGEVTGEISGEDLDFVLRQAELKCRPPISAGWEQMETEGGTVIAVSIPRSTELHALDDGRILMRTGTLNRPLAGDEVVQLASSRTTGAWETSVAAGVTVEDFDEDIITQYLQKREARMKRPLAGTREQLFYEIGAADDAGRPTNMGVLLFCTNPQRWIPQSSVLFIRFVGREPRGESGLAGYARREEIGGPIARVIEGAWNLVWSEMAVGAVVKGLEREESPEYPPFAVREAIVNAICHRDYRLRGRHIEIRMYADRLEVISPGGLPGFMTLDNLVDEHYSRNPRLVDGLFQWGYIEALGLGIDRMIEEMVQSGLKEPDFEAQPHAFKVQLFNARERAPEPVRPGNLNDRQVRALEYVRANGAITNREYQQLCPNVSSETLRLDLVDLVEKGTLLKIGAKRGTYYILK